MKKIYIQIIDPLNNVCINACHEYPNDYVQAISTTLMHYGLPGDTRKFEVSNDCKSHVPKMPDYLLLQGAIEGTSKLVSIIAVGI